MTEWELAVQYADKVALEYIGVKSDYGGYANIRDAFLNGLRLGKQTKWHKVADGDLPKKDERFVANVSIPVMTQNNDFASYSFDKEKWYSRGIEISNVIAWCEIPKYEETE